MDTLILQDDFRRLVKARLELLGISRSELARRMGVSRQKVTNYLNENSGNPNDNLKEEFFRALGCRPRLHLEELAEAHEESVA